MYQIFSAPSLSLISSSIIIYIIFTLYSFFFITEYGFIKPVDRSEQIYFRVEDFRDSELAQIREVNCVLVFHVNCVLVLCLFNVLIRLLIVIEIRAG